MTTLELARVAFEAWCHVPLDYHDREKHLQKAWDACSPHTIECWRRVAFAVREASAGRPVEDINLFQEF